MILKIGISFLAIAGFGLSLWVSRIVPVMRNTIKATMVGLSSMMDIELDDVSKEKALRRAGIDLILASFSIFWRFVVALTVAAVPIFIFDGIGVVSRDAVFSLMLRSDYIIIVSVVVIVLMKLFRHWFPAAEETTSVQNRYTTTDQFFHVMAFSSPAVLKIASRVEDLLLSTPPQEPSAPPIFITSLARGGTTPLLNALHDIPGIATHTYRDMPFLTAPNLWSRLAGGQKRHVDRHQRAHGDGLEIDLDSPEAFEEVIWKMFWPEKFRDSSIALWRAEDRKLDADQFLKRHMAKIIRARLAQGKEVPVNTTARYCSKNNGNIARLAYLVQSFPECRIVVPLRRPECHAASLLRQHQNFLRLQADDDFIRRYMRDIGHFEFGQIHKPIQFPGFEAERYDPTTGDYWLDYWIHAFHEILLHSDKCIFVLQDDLRTSPQTTMKALCSALDLAHGSLQFTAYFRSVPDETRTDLYNQRLYKEASELYRVFEELAQSKNTQNGIMSLNKA